ncbi:sugar-binding domain-containing protein [uncultured Polaribacter sp.]|uniref:sugar-binding domain-containing protein n=1 Tax=uncultured Polaribacter sp. TaxID=174711 RepID=UPI002616E291|nr:sugar-binding domain-containing protein [uncultured Polaribacter sp.]
MKFYNTIKYLLICLTLFVLFVSCGNEKDNGIDLSGEWNFKIDSLDKGVSEKWYKVQFLDTITLPGSMNTNNKGDELSVKTKWTGNIWDNDSVWFKDPKMAKYRQKGNIKLPFWLTPNKKYTGAAWYQKKVTIPADWKGKNINLYLERVHWESTVWVDAIKVGMQNSLSTAHNYNLGNVLTVGEHTITVRVDNRVKDIDVGLDAHSISDNTQSNWNGIIGDIKLVAKPKIAIGNVKLYPNVADKKVKVVIQIESEISNVQIGRLFLEATEKSTTNVIKESKKDFKDIVINGNQEVVLEYDMGDNPKLWDEFNPNVYQMQITLDSKFGVDTKNIDFGMREFKADGKVFTINGRKTFLRGTLESAIFPLTGYPPTDVDAWKAIYKIIKNHGLNHVRFHSWCPPKAAFTAADQEGIYLQVEASAWTKIGDGEPIDRWLYKEGEDIINAYGNHPSFVMMTYGNEPSGKNQKEYLKNYVDFLRSLDPSKMYTSAAGWPMLDNLDFFNHRGPRIQGWNENLKSVINAKAPQTLFDWSNFIDKTPMPYVSHEMGQWCVYPNFEEMSKYTGVLKPKNFEIFQETLVENGMADLAKQFLMASGKLQTLCYKADIEAALRTKNMAGFQLLDLHDFPGQGTALIGVLDAFWGEKGYVSPDEFRAFSGQTVPLARFTKRTFKNIDTLNVKVEVAHFGEKILKDVTPTWVLKTTDNTTFAEGNLSKKDIEIGNGIQLGEINVSLLKIDKAQKLTLSVAVKEFTNTWDLWVYPNEKPIISNEENITVVNKLDAKTIDYLNKGGNVLFNITKGDIALEKGGDIGIGFSSIFWNTSWTNGQKPHTLGILCNPKHPALADFPTEYHSNWQWWDAMSNSNAIILDDLPALTPIVRVVDDWFKNRKLALVFEVKVGKGKLVMSGIDLHTNLETRLEAKQLLYSLKKYMTSNSFKPKIKLEINQIKNLLK